MTIKDRKPVVDCVYADVACGGEEERDVLPSSSADVEEEEEVSKSSTKSRGVVGPGNCAESLYTDGTFTLVSALS